jgi:hypothetical protein
MSNKIITKNTSEKEENSIFSETQGYKWCIFKNYVSQLNTFSSKTIEIGVFEQNDYCVLLSNSIENSDFTLLKLLIENDEPKSKIIYQSELEKAYDNNKVAYEILKDSPQLKDFARAHSFHSIISKFTNDNVKKLIELWSNRYNNKPNHPIIGDEALMFSIDNSQSDVDIILTSRNIKYRNYDNIIKHVIESNKITVLIKLFADTKFRKKFTLNHFCFACILGNTRIVKYLLPYPTMESEIKSIKIIMLSWTN